MPSRLSACPSGEENAWLAWPPLSLDPPALKSSRPEANCNRGYYILHLAPTMQIEKIASIADLEQRDRH
jgi:hypothetical protein